MIKNKVISIIRWVVVILFLINSFVAYFAYKDIINKKEPFFKINVKEKKENKIYQEGFYKVIVKEDDDLREVSLKLFFLK